MHRTASHNGHRRKAPKRIDRLEQIQHEAWQNLREPLERRAKRLYEPALPFQIHTSNDATPAAVREPLIDGAEDDWDILRFEDPPRYWIDIANQALNSGLRLSFDVPRPWACQLTAMLVCRLGADITAAYDVIRKRLVLWHNNEDELNHAASQKFSECNGKVLV